MSDENRHKKGQLFGQLAEKTYLCALFNGQNSTKNASAQCRSAALPAVGPAISKPSRHFLQKKKQ
jgi:hypothetical protein